MASLLKSRKVKAVIIAGLILTILFAGLILYIYALVSGYNPTALPNPPTPTLSASILRQDLLSYNYGKLQAPYVLLQYNVTNMSMLYMNATIYKYKTPETLYILNYSNGCLQCINITEVISTIKQSLQGYNLPGLANASDIAFKDLNNMKNNSILLVLNGLMPSYFFTKNPKTNTTEIDYLLSKRISIVYVGLNFSQELLPTTPATEQQAQNVPGYLSYVPTMPQTMPKVKNFGYYITNVTFSFRNGSVYGLLPYINDNNGSIIAFPNTLASWPNSTKAGLDISKAIWQMFWLQKYGYGSVSFPPKQSSGNGKVGILMNGQPIPLYSSSPLWPSLDTGYLRVVIGANSLFARNQESFKYIKVVPQIYQRGIVSMEPNPPLNQTNVPIQFNITIKPQHPVKLGTSIAIYDQNFTRKISVPGSKFSNFSNTSESFTIWENLGVGPGTYILTLLNFTDGTELAGGYFTVAPINITLIGANFTTGRYVFYLTTQKTPLNRVNYTISLNNLYSVSGPIKKGIISYRLPAGAPIPTGRLGFNITILTETFPLTYYYRNAPFSINAQYIEVGVVVLLMIIMLIFVKAPERDEYYIDVPNLPEEKKTDIKISANELTQVFDKLNINYHWKYMPLSKPELKSAISFNIKYNNIPVELTYHNIDSILDSMVVNKKIVGIDGLYAPLSWIDASKHDIEYLATFKKMRIYFVTHAYTFTDIDTSTEADIVANLHGEKKYIIIYSKTSRFRKMPIYPNSKTYLAFLNSYTLDEFKENLYDSAASAEAEKLKMYISSDYIRLIDADNIDRDIR